MKLGFVVNDVATEKPQYSTTRLAMKAVELGHACWLMGVGDFVYSADGTIRAVAHAAPEGRFETLTDFLGAIQSEDACCDRIVVDDLDVLWMRYDPAADKRERPWAQSAGLLFGELAVARGTIVLNDPRTLAGAINKTYFQHFPEAVRPKTCISRHADEIKQFVADQGGTAVLKPLQGSGGDSVFLVRDGDSSNLNQMIEAVTRDGYCIVQEYLLAAAKGDVRLFVMNGDPLVCDGHHAAFRRVNGNGDVRSNMHVGGTSEPAEVTPEMLKLADAVRPKLVRDGMFLVGLDIVEDKLMEINVFSPGGLGSAATHTGVDFTVPILAAVQRKVDYRRQYPSQIDNCEIAVL